jgi:hypothetical protein
MNKRTHVVTVTDKRSGITIQIVDIRPRKKKRV